MVKLNLYKDKPHLNEIFQSLDIKFSFVTQQGEGEFTQIIPPCKCRDFLIDMLWSKYYTKPASIYGMFYEYISNPFDADALKLSLKFPTEETKDNFIANVPKFLHPIEELVGELVPTKVLDTDDGSTLIIIADPKWQSATWKLSLYTYYLKLCGFDDPNSPPSNSNEAGYKKRMPTNIEEILLNHIKDDFVWYAEDIMHNHNYSGFVTTIQNELGTNGNSYHLFDEEIIINEEDDNEM